MRQGKRRKARQCVADFIAFGTHEMSSLDSGTEPLPQSWVLKEEEVRESWKCKD
jgi:hypothetical protein